MRKSNKVQQKAVTKQEDFLLGIMSELTYYRSKDGLCATISYEDRKKSVLITSTEYSDYISSKYYMLYGKIPKADWIKERLQLIRYAQKEQYADDVIYEERYVNDNGEILINMANEKFQYICVSRNGYKVATPEDDTPLFIKNAMESPMVEPVGKDIDALDMLDNLLNLSEDDKFFLKVWLVTAMNPDIRTPILYFLGAAGSGKSSIQNLIKDLINPTERGAVNWDGSTPKEMAIALSRSYLINYDNVSKIDQVRSDILCQTTTGANKSFRKLYTDNEEINYDLKSRVTITSVRNCISKSDLAERIYFMNMSKLNTRKRIREDEYSAYYLQNLPKIMGGLVATLALAIRKYESWCNIHTATYRLASFELFGGLVASILDMDNGYGRFQRIMRKNHIQQVFANDEKRPYFESMLEMLDADVDPFDGKMRDFYDYINDWIMEYSELSYDEDIILDYETFTKAIHQYKNGIASLGYDIKFYKSRPDNYSSILIGKSENLESA